MQLVALLRLAPFCLAVTSAMAADASAAFPAHVPNFGIVNRNLLRGGEPTAVGMAELGAAGVKVDIDLRESGAHTELEKQIAEKLGIRYVNVPLPELSAPSTKDVHKILTLLNNEQNQVLFVHCRRGKDRTGAIIACYRIQHDGWDRHRALAEARSYGLSGIERGMRSFILHFAPDTSGSGLANPQIN